MYKTKWSKLFLLTNTILVTTLYSYADTNSHLSAALQQPQPMISSTLKGAEWVRLCIHQYPEILYLADGEVRKTEEGQASLQETYSEQLFGKKCIEFDRTIMTLHCLKLILDGSDEAYQEFTKAQVEDTKLLKESFEALHRQGISLIRSGHQGMSELEIIQSMEASLILGDIGKSEKARKIFRPYGAKAPDHDDFHEEVIKILQKHPELCPTFHRLTPASKELISQTANLAHYGHITHIEGGPSMFSKLKQKSQVASFLFALLFDFFVHTCDVAGALGHVNNQSSLAYTEPSHLAMQATLDSCKILKAPHKTEKDAYEAYLAIRASWLGLNPKDRKDRVLARAGAMSRLFTPQEGAILKQSFLTLPLPVQNQIIKELDTQDGKELKRNPTYMPAVLVNLANNPQLGSSKEERIAQIVHLGLPFLARVLETYKQSFSAQAASEAAPLNFNKAAGAAKTSPKALEGKYSIDPEGNVCLLGS